MPSDQGTTNLAASAASAGSPPVPLPRVDEKAAEELEAGRLRHLRRLAARDRGLRMVLATPFVLLCPVAASIAHYMPPTQGVWPSIAVSLVLPAIAVLYVFALLMWEWSSWSYAYRHYPQATPAVDWADPRWHPVRDALVATGFDPGSILAVSVFSVAGNLKTIHRPRFSPGRVGALYARAAGFTVRHIRLVLVLGASAGALVSLLDTVRPGWRDVHGSPPIAVLIVGSVIVAVLLAIGIRNATMQVRLNLLHPQSVVQIPTTWRTALAKSPPGARVTFLHEMSHARHGDMGVRRISAYVRSLALFAAWLNAAGTVLAQLPGPVPAALFLLEITCTTMCVRRAARLLYTVQEMRADTDACLDAAAMREMADLVERAQQKEPSPIQAARLHALRGQWADPVAAPYRRIVIAMSLGGVLPVLIPVALVWSGIVPVSLLSSG